jgi:hypothetical protein
MMYCALFGCAGATHFQLPGFPPDAKRRGSLERGAQDTIERGCPQVVNQTPQKAKPVPLLAATRLGLGLFQLGRGLPEQVHPALYRIGELDH